MNAADILKAAAATLDQRGKDYDQPHGERSMGRIVETFNALTGNMLTEAQGWQFMACLKLVRMTSAADPTDSAIDCAAYAALAGEALARDKERTARNKAALKAAQAAVIEPDADGWIPWEGGECPVDGDVDVEIRLSDGTETIEAAGLLKWGETGEPYDIVAYRLAEQESPPQKLERLVPKIGERYFYVELEAVNEAVFEGNREERWYIAFGNCFRTREEAEVKFIEIYEG